MFTRLPESKRQPIALGLFLAAILTAVAQDEVPNPDSIIPLSNEQVLFYYKGKWTDQVTGQEYPLGTHVINGRGGLLRLEKERVVRVHGEGGTVSAGYIEVRDAGNSLILAATRTASGPLPKNTG